MPKGISLADAFDEAQKALGDTDLEGVESEEPEVSEPPETPEVSEPEASEEVAEVEEQPAEADDEEEEAEELSLENIDLAGEQPDEEQDSRPTIDWNEKIEVPGIGELTLLELRDGYLRQADYTRKTQALAEQRREVESSSEEVQNALKLYNMLKEDTVGTVRQLALEAGILSEDAAASAGGSNNVVGLAAPTEEQIAKMVEERVVEVLQNSPEIEAIRRQQYAAQVEAEFDRIENEYSIDLSQEAKLRILDNAVKTGRDIEYTFLKMKAAVDRANAEKDRVRGARSKATRSRTPTKDISNERPKSIHEAYERALVQIASQ